MRTELTLETIAAFRDRFGQLHDAVIYNISFDLFPFHDRKPDTMILRLGAVDTLKEDDNKWTYLIFTIEEVVEYSLKKKKDYDSSVLQEVFIGFLEDTIYMDFNPHTLTYQTASEFTESLTSPYSVLFMVAAKKCYWEEVIQEDLF